MTRYPTALGLLLLVALTGCASTESRNPRSRARTALSRLKETLSTAERWSALHMGSRKVGYGRRTIAPVDGGYRIVHDRVFQTALGRVETRKEVTTDRSLRPLGATWKVKGRILDFSRDEDTVSFELAWKSGAVRVSRLEGESRTEKTYPAPATTVVYPIHLAHGLAVLGPADYVFETLRFTDKGVDYKDDCVVRVLEEDTLKVDGKPLRAVEVVVDRRSLLFSPAGALVRGAGRHGGVRVAETAAAEAVARAGLPEPTPSHPALLSPGKPAGLLGAFLLAILKKDGKVLDRCFHWERLVQSTLTEQGKAADPDTVEQMVGFLKPMLLRSLLGGQRWRFGPAILLSLSFLDKAVSVERQGPARARIGLKGEGTFQVERFDGVWKIVGLVKEGK